MIEWYLLFIPAVTAITNRLWRGEGNVPRWVWYIFMTSLAVLASVHFTDYPLETAKRAGIFLLIWLGYALAPWQAMFSAITGRAPGRKDSAAWQWMQILTSAICGNAPIFSQADIVAYYRKFGIVYGVFRGALTLPGVCLMAWYTHSLVPLAGALFLLMGCVYYFGHLVTQHFSLAEDIGVPVAEVSMGWWLGTYMLICAAVMR